jgi:hypothetical protein
MRNEAMYFHAFHFEVFIMRIFSKLALAVGATLAASSAFALVDQNTAYSFSLNVAGSSAFRDSFKTQMGTTLCQDSVVQFTASSGDFRAYGCTVKTSVTLSNNTTFTFPANTPILVYYRSEGGSVFGVGPIAKDVQEMRLVVDSTCTGSGTAYTCANTYNGLDLDTGSGHMVKDYVQLGVSDVEPDQFKGENYPTSGFLAPVATNPRANMRKVDSAIGQAFAIYVNTSLTGSAATPLVLSKQDITSIFSGLYSDWSQVPLADGSGFLPAGSIFVCRRDVGSGTQAGASIYFNDQGCSKAGYTFTSGNQINNSTGAMLTCINGHAGAIGIANIQSQAKVGVAGTTPMSIVNIDGMVPSVLNAANGHYDYWFEATFNTANRLVANSNPDKLAQIMIDRLSNAATTPASDPSVFALPVGSNTPTLPQADPTHPISLGTRGGNSCAQPVGYN